MPPKGQDDLKCRLDLVIIPEGLGEFSDRFDLDCDLKILR